MGHYRLLANVSKFCIMSILCLPYYLPHYKELIAEKKKKLIVSEAHLAPSGIFCFSIGV